MAPVRRGRACLSAVLPSTLNGRWTRPRRRSTGGAHLVHIKCLAVPRQRGTQTHLASTRASTTLARRATEEAARSKQSEFVLALECWRQPRAGFSCRHQSHIPFHISRRMFLACRAGLFDCIQRRWAGLPGDASMHAWSSSHGARFPELLPPSPACLDDGSPLLSLFLSPPATWRRATAGGMARGRRLLT